MSVDFFSEALSRLKHELRVSKDGEVAALIGLGKTAFSERKKRGSFPDREVVALARNRPELGVDVAFVLTGVRAKTQATLAGIRAAADVAARMPGDDEGRALAAAAIARQIVLQSDEQMLLDAYRAMDAAGKKALLSAALGVSPPASVAQHNQGDNAIQVAHAAGKVSIKRR